MAIVSKHRKIMPISMDIRSKVLDRDMEHIFGLITHIKMGNGAMAKKKVMVNNTNDSMTGRKGFGN